MYRHNGPRAGRNGRLHLRRVYRESSRVNVNQNGPRPCLFHRHHRGDGRVADGNDLVTGSYAHSAQCQDQRIGARGDSHAVLSAHVGGKLRLESARLFTQNIPPARQHAVDSGVYFCAERTILSSQVHCRNG